MFTKLAWTSLAICIALATSSPAFATASATHALGNKYIYVTDARARALIVYKTSKLQLGSPSPDRSLVYGKQTGPQGVAVNPLDGNVYVAVGGPSSDTIDIYSRGAKNLVGTIGYGQGITSIRDIAFAKDGTMFVTCVNVAIGEVGIAKFAPNSHSIETFYKSPTSQTYGVVVDKKGNPYADLGFYGTAIEFPQNARSQDFVVVGIGGAPTLGGLAFIQDDMIMTGAGGLYVFTPSLPGAKYRFTRTGDIGYGVGTVAGYPCTTDDGTLYVPLHGNINEIRVYPESDMNSQPQFSTYWAITRGMTLPLAVAVGPQ